MHGTEVPTQEQLSDILKKWDEVSKTPLWYRQVVPVLLDWWKNLPRDEHNEALKNRIYNYFADKLEKAELF